MKIIHYRYKIDMRCMVCEEIDVRETENCYIGEYCRILKSDDGIPRLKDRTSYPYVDCYSTKDTSKGNAIRSILKMFMRDMI